MTTMTALSQPYTPQAKHMDITSFDRTRYELVWVNPERAAAWLAKNVVNRPLRPTHWKKFVKAMLNRQWESASPVPICIDINGNLIDGRHRLRAVVESGTSVKMRVAFDCDPKTQKVIDQDVLIRNNSDFIFKATGEKVSTGDLSVAKLISFGLLARSLSSNDALTAWQAHRNAVTFTTEHLCGRTHSRGISSAPVRAPIARAWYTADRDRLALFCSCLKTGMVQNEADSAALKLRDLLIAGGVRGGTAISSAGGVRTEVYKKVEAALSAFLERRAISKLYPRDKELFPIPRRIMDYAI